ncbi:MAG: hypothetical protein JRI25_05755 [Deltaproteobacteria bacterium]|nr:hypothetical protein [Deltaproteobacteria bacterium]
MDLPMVDEIRETRRIAMEATDAAVHLSRVRGILNTLAMLDRKLTAQPNAEFPLPGDDVVEELSERWTSLSDLTAAGPRPTQSIREQLRFRRQQMEAAQQLLAPLARRQNALAEELHELQHKQRDLMEDPKYAEAAADLAKLATERDQVARELQPLDQRVNTVASLQKLAVTFLGRIDDAIATTGAHPGIAAFRAAAVAGSLVEALQRVRDQLQVDVPVPSPLEVPAEPDPAREEEMFAEVARLRAGLVEAIEALEADIMAHKDDMDALRERFDKVNQRLFDRMG